MDSRKIIRDFYHAFEKLDLEGILPLFALEAKIHSPTMGTMDPEPFYRDLFHKTKRIKVVLKDIFVNPDKSFRAAAYINMTWEIKVGSPVVFEGVMIFEMTPQHKIRQIDIIYDAARAREVLAKLH